MQARAHRWSAVRPPPIHDLPLARRGSASRHVEFPTSRSLRDDDHAFVMMMDR
jgi:hypothetical protein